MKYYDPEELSSIKDELRETFSKDGSSLIINTGRARQVVSLYARKGDAILDVGCGKGEFLKQLHDDGFTNLHGLDFDPYHDVLLQSFKSADLSWDKMPWTDNSFDVVSGWEVIEHLENPPHFLREMRRILKPGGRLILSTPNVDGLYNRFVFLKSGDMPRWREPVATD
jgi:2-polyprenyl-3-methyl-5-hydroxy-6-metoxy-1,4-benzoquinol methylase